ncbi:uncharacterized protein LOC115331181 isoform X2 [Ixodes scapularis]|uniref:uncharacterized protein LOC115331181 isoform X2 n=1 Tax=Ixodes scapularis TaxID=6945 RepID=UPI001C37FB8F|nr:uncharacterized protein LOC115331181 isoform X2 [Ixodes scapularis]XP_029849133.2 uncharacterized protein LOC115331181 isoform X2 [Ixodes scapularis]
MCCFARPSHVFHLLLLVAMECHGGHEELMSEVLALNAVRRALTCLESRGSSKPLVALSSSRLLQFHQFQKHSRHDALCFPTETGVQAHCNVGKCIEPGVCRCFFGFSGDKCTSYRGRCWLLHCFLRDCYSANGARLRCLCDPSLYGIQVLSGLYWYPEGLSGSYKPPPESWTDDIPSQAKDADFESYKLEGVDEEIDLSLYQRAVAAATARKADSLGLGKKADVRPSATRQFGQTLRTRITRPDPSLWNKTIISYLMSQISELSKSEQIQKVIKGIPGSRTSLKTTDVPVATKSAKNSLERDFGEDLKFVYENYVPLDEGAVVSAAARPILQMPHLSLWTALFLAKLHAAVILNISTAALTCAHISTMQILSPSPLLGKNK